MNIGWTIPLIDTWGMHGDIGTGWWIVMMVAMVIFWVAVVLGIVWLLRGAVLGWQRHAKESPTEILERRFAEGAISAEDYRERRHVLANNRASPVDAGRQQTTQRSERGTSGQ